MNSDLRIEWIPGLFAFQQFSVSCNFNVKSHLDVHQFLVLTQVLSHLGFQVFAFNLRIFGSYFEFVFRTTLLKEISLKKLIAKALQLNWHFFTFLWFIYELLQLPLACTFMYINNSHNIPANCLLCPAGHQCLFHIFLPILLDFVAKSHSAVNNNNKKLQWSWKYLFPPTVHIPNLI